MRIRLALSTVLLGCGLLIGLFGAGVIVSWHRDNVILYDFADSITHNVGNKADKVSQLNKWVYHWGGFAKNRHFFLLPQLGPTPTDILEGGGDCADKSRLLSVLLHEIGVPSGLVMLYPCPNCTPVHTVVEAQLEGGRMVADPTWGVDYPASIEQLSRSRLPMLRAAALQSLRGVHPGAGLMPPSHAIFRYARPINFDRDIPTRATGRLLAAAGVDLRGILRPRILEDPKLLVGAVALLLSLCLSLPGCLLRRGAHSWTASRVNTRIRFSPPHALPLFDAVKPAAGAPPETLR